MIRIEDIVEKVERNYPQADLNLLRKAYIFSALHHRDQKRANGEPYLIHPLEVANILADMRLDVVSVSTGLLHDVVEDTLVNLETIQKTFGDEVTLLVDGLTKIANISSKSKEEQQAENVRKMIFAMVKDARMVFIKLADRLHNMRTLEFLKAEKQKRIAQETLDIYAPIAHRLGMGKVRGELEDLSFKYLEPEDYHNLEEQLEKRRLENEEFLAGVTGKIEEKMDEAGIPFVKIEGRVKRLYSIWKKLKKQKITLDQVYDLVAIRIITPDDEIRHCYAALGVVHNIWTPVSHRIKDWIAIPRDNLYRALHTSVIGSKGHPFEIQLRTEIMHQDAEEGVAAHWKYKENKRSQEDDEILKRLRALVESTQEAKDSHEFIESLKLELHPKDIYAFTPMGKIIQLPHGATPIDFAYAIHTEVGNKCTGARINGKIVPLRTQLQNGDSVEIMTNPNSHPSRDWLNHVVTTRARNRVRHWVAEQQRAESIDIGRKIFEKEAYRFNLSGKKLLSEDNKDFKRIANEYGLGRVEDLLASIGYGKIMPRNVIAKYLGPEKFTELDTQKESRLKSGLRAVKKIMRLGDDAIQVSGVDDLLVTRARCCNPLRGEPIIGYVSLGKGVVVHTKTCKNVQQLMVNKDRIVEVEWVGASDGKEAYAVKLLALTENRTGMIAGITGAISDMKTNIRDTRASVGNDERGRIEVTVEVFDVKHLDKVITSIKNIPGVIDVERLQGVV